MTRRPLGCLPLGATRVSGATRSFGWLCQFSAWEPIVLGKMDPFYDNHKYKFELARKYYQMASSLKTSTPPSKPPRPTHVQQPSWPNSFRKSMTTRESSSVKLGCWHQCCSVCCCAARRAREKDDRSPPAQAWSRRRPTLGRGSSRGSGWIGLQCRTSPFNVLLRPMLGTVIFFVHIDIQIRPGTQPDTKKSPPGSGS